MTEYPLSAETHCSLNWVFERIFWGFFNSYFAVEQLLCWPKIIQRCPLISMGYQQLFSISQQCPLSQYYYSWWSEKNPVFLDHIINNGVRLIKLTDALHSKSKDAFQEIVIFPKNTYVYNWILGFIDASMSFAVWIEFVDSLKRLFPWHMNGIHWMKHCSESGHTAWRCITRQVQKQRTLLIFAYTKSVAFVNERMM